MVLKTQLTTWRLREQQYNVLVKRFPSEARVINVPHCLGPILNLNTDSDAAISKEEEDIGLTAQCSGHNNKAIDCQDTTSASLADYIVKAQREVLGDDYAKSAVFGKSSTASMPMVEKARINRVILFVGCFNPPHRAHLELLCHAFLRTDNVTIAAMIMPTDTLGAKDNTRVNRSYLNLSKNHRTQLWDDEVLSRFAWVWPGKLSEVEHFCDTMKSLTKADGLSMEFTSVHGPDHSVWEADNWGWGDGSVITSDITRPVEFLDDSSGKWASPPQVPGWGRWMRTRQAEDLALTPASHHCPESPCWICWKVAKVFGAYFEPGFFERQSLNP
jgi:hypothetical protein